MPVKIFVGNLAYGITEYTLRPLFEVYGTVSECDVLGSYGFVHMDNEDEATIAIEALNSYRLHGSSLKVERSTAATQGKKLGTLKTTKIFIGNIKFGTSSVQLRSLFEEYGTVSDADVIGSYGFVHMVAEREALEAIKALNGYKLNGSPINVELSTRDTQGKAKGQDGFVPSESFRGRGGTAGGSSRGRGRGGLSSRFDPYSAPSGYLPRSEMYAAASLPAPPTARAAPASDDTSFARELLQLYTKDPAAFDAYARNPDVRRSLNLQSESSAASAAALRYSDSYLKPPHEFLMEPRSQHRMLAPSAVMMDSRMTSVSSRTAAGHRGMRQPLYMSFE